MIEADRRDEFGDEFRAKADKQRQQFVNWIAVASAGGIALVMAFAQQNQAVLYILRPSLVAWLTSVVAAGAALYGFYLEAAFAATSFHRQAERERQQEKLQALSSNDPMREPALKKAQFLHERADINHGYSRLWLKVAGTCLVVASGAFLLGAGYAINLIASSGLTPPQAIVAAPNSEKVTLQTARIAQAETTLLQPQPIAPKAANPSILPPDSKWVIAPLVTFVGIVVSGFLAVMVPIFTSWRQRRLAAKAAALVAQDALGLIIDRLAIRFNPMLLPAEGPTLREYRATAAVSTLVEMKLSELPAQLIPHFSRLRSGLFALNSAMSHEGQDDPAEKQTLDGKPHPSTARLARYSNVFSWTIGSYEAIRSTPRIGKGLTDFSWRPPSAPSIISASGVDFSTLPQP